MFSIGDRVRVIPRSYVDLSKNFLNYPSCWKPSNPVSDEKLMLGGKYTVLAVEKEAASSRCWYSLLQNGVNNMGKASSSALAEESEIRPCDFQVGDKVVFRPACSPEDVQFLETSMEHCYQLSDRAREHVVKRILNDYYVFIDYDVDADCAFPFRWEDFQRAG